VEFFRMGADSQRIKLSMVAFKLHHRISQARYRLLIEENPGLSGNQNWSSGTYVAKVTNVTGTNDVLIMSGLSVSSGFNISLLATNGSSPAFTAFNPTKTATGSTPVASSYIVLAKDTDTNSSTNPFANQSVLSLLTLTTTGISARYGDTLALDTMAISGGSGGYQLIAEDVTAPEPTSFLLLGTVVSPLLLGRRRRHELPEA
jgi:hypothetical protein